MSLAHSTSGLFQPSIVAAEQSGQTNYLLCESTVAAAAAVVEVVVSAAVIASDGDDVSAVAAVVLWQ